MGLLGNNFLSNFGAGNAWNTTRSFSAGNREKRVLFLQSTNQEGTNITLKRLSNPVGSNMQSSWQQPVNAGGASMRILSKGGLSGTAILEKTMTIDLTGFGDLSAEGSLVISALCNMTGSGTLTADIAGLFNASIDFSGNGNLSADIVGIANAVIDMIGSGELSADIVGIASPSIDIVVTGTGLTTANVGNAVWSELLEGNYTAKQCMELLTAIAAGKTTIVDLGGGLATVTFRDINDTTNRVVADMTNSERTDVTKNL